MKLFASGRAVNVSMGEGSSLIVGVNDTSPHEARQVRQLVGANAAMLDQRFSGVTDRYGSILTAGRAIRRVIASENVASLSLVAKEQGKSRLIGRATLMLGSVACGDRETIANGANYAIWLDVQYRGHGIGKAVSRYVVSEARREYPGATHFTLVEDDNTPSHHMVQAVGYTPHGPPGSSYEFAGATYENTQLYIHGQQPA